MGTYVGPPRPNRAERRQRAKDRARVQRGMTRAAKRAMEENAKANAEGQGVRWWDADWRPGEVGGSDHEES